MTVLPGAPLLRLCTVIHYRPFRNSDPPRLAEIWCEQPPQRGVMQPVTASLLEQFVFSKPYFDPRGLIVAVADKEPVGFIHAGFGPNESQSAIDTTSGTTYQLMLRAAYREPAIAEELLARAESYLRDCGAQVLYAGGIRPLNGFYLGLYGGSELPGVLATEPTLHTAAARRSYREIDRVIVLQLDLSGYRLPITRELRRMRREATFSENHAPRDASWWEACTEGVFDRIQFSLSRVGDNEPVAQVWFWDIEPLSMAWGVPTAGLVDLHVSASCRRQGLASFLLGEAFERLRDRGVLRVETQTMRHNAPALALYQKLGFLPVDEGIVYRKDA